jgi:hypothetical protein
MSSNTLMLENSIIEPAGQVEHISRYPSDVLDVSTFIWYLILAFHGVRIAFWGHSVPDATDANTKR